MTRKSQAWESQNETDSSLVANSLETLVEGDVSLSGEIPREQTPALVLDHISFEFQSQHVLSHLHLLLPEGGVTGVVGVSGSGKSLVLKMAAGLISPSKGRVFYRGNDVAMMSEAAYQRMQSQTGFHFQDAALWANMSLWDNLALPLMAAHPSMDEATVAHLVQQALDDAKLRINPHLRPAEVSLGHRKMVGYLRATMNQPALLFLDEPSSFLERGSQRVLLNMLSAQKAKGVTMLLATHNFEYIEALADSIAVLDEGQCVAYGPKSDVFDRDDARLKRVLRELM
ncbi:MAG: ATP-binding cassette domain-containing protein [Spirochaetales bacterium]|nr:ATP-binding cassette domain-containing protein [Spirochaetales bacterium]